MLKYFLPGLFSLLSIHFCRANMASPETRGTLGALAISSRDISILKEKIKVVVDKDFRSAVYTVNYIVLSDTQGVQIPLLFYAVDYQGNFSVFLDGREIPLSNVPGLPAWPDSIFPGFMTPLLSRRYPGVFR